MTFEFLDNGNCIELHYFFEIKGLPYITPGEDYVLFNVGEVSNMIIESFRVTENKIQSVNTHKRKREMEEQFIFQPVIKYGPITDMELYPHNTFISKERNSQKNPEDISKIWGISLSQAALTLKSTTRKLVRLAIMTLAYIYRAD